MEVGALQAVILRQGSHHHCYYQCTRQLVETAEGTAIVLADSFASVAPLRLQRHAGIAVGRGADDYVHLLTASLWPPAGQVAVIFDRPRGRLPSDGASI